MSHHTRDDDDHDRAIRSEERLCQIDEKWIAHAQVHDLEARALALQHTEYARRLETLNHEAQRIATDKLTYLPREVYDADVVTINRRFAVLETFHARAIGFGALLALLSGAVGAAIARAIGG
jgi:hypothetical protein